MELLVVLAIAAGVIALAPAAYRAAVPSAQLRHDTLELVAQLRGARDEALATQKAVGVPLTQENVRLAYQPAFGAVDDRIVFAPDGTSTGGQVMLMSDAGELVIAINWLTGHIAVQP